MPTQCTVPIAILSDLCSLLCKLLLDQIKKKVLSKKNVVQHWVLAQDPEFSSQMH